MSLDDVSIPFREDLHSDETQEVLNLLEQKMFPSLSGKTSIRTWKGRGILATKKKRFHPFQGRPLFGRPEYKAKDVLQSCAVSIPFREDLYSDIVAHTR